MVGPMVGTMELAVIRTRTIYKRGFTLIELLVVIAVIAILAALLFPVFAHVREQVHQTNCMSNMAQLYSDLKLYKEDNGKYPPILICNPYIQNAAPPPVQVPYAGIPATTPLNAQSVLNRPFNVPSGQKYDKDVTVGQCPDNLVKDQTKVVTGAVYPQGVPLSVTGPTNTWYYSFDSYDTGPQINASGNVNPGVTEIHYSLDWTGTIGANDPQNQLKYPDPPQDKTVVTWCTYHVSVAKTDQIMVLLLNGSAKQTQYSKFVYKSIAQPQGPLFFAP